MTPTLSSHDRGVLFSIVVPTGNRPKDLAVTLEGIRQQKHQNYEVIIVNNGTKPEFVADYSSLEKHFDHRFRFLNFHNDFSQGFGPAIARNIGIEAAKGEYIAFCDDDDKWINNEYLEVISQRIQKYSPIIIISEQQGLIIEDGKEVITRPEWFTQITEPMFSKKVEVDFYSVNFDYFIERGALPHLNITIYKKEQLVQETGFDRSLWYEEDLDLFLRMVASYDDIYFNNQLVASHYIPDKSQNKNITSNVGSVKINQVRMLIANKLLTNEPSINIQKYAQKMLMNSSKHITEYFVSEKKYAVALGYSKLALSLKFTVKWFVYSAYLFIKKLLHISKKN